MMKAACCFLLIVAAARATICPHDACDNAECENPGLRDVECGPNRFEPNGGACGCCPTCITLLKVGEDCSDVLLIGWMQTSECEGNLKCDSITRKCDYRCIEEHATQQVNMMPGQFVPRCENDGSYSPFQCRGSGCYCVSKDGTRIRGFTSVNRGAVQDMNCKCARDKHEYSKLKMIGKHFNCASNGNYDKVQCMGSVCFCADENGRMALGAQRVPIGQHHTLNC
ncbi:equistatin-like [Lineus longissimus]|uniref:equistatin-like n=1 Tax=Lineus longissimus TaxID=88925 RepID=UPI00315DC666